MEHYFTQLLMFMIMFKLTFSQGSSATYVQSVDVSLLHAASDVIVSQFQNIQNQVDENRNEFLELQQFLRESCTCCSRKGLLVDGKEKNITTDQITTSSNWNDLHGPDRVRINNALGSGIMAWCPETPSANDWVQFDFGNSSNIFGIVTKGRVSSYNQRVTSYKIQFGDRSDDLKTFTDVLGNEQIFPGNQDQNTAKVNMFWQSVSARFIRLLPQTQNTWNCLRADVIGCID